MMSGADAPTNLPSELITEIENFLIFGVTSFLRQGGTGMFFAWKQDEKHHSQHVVNGDFCHLEQQS